MRPLVLTPSKRALITKSSLLNDRNFPLTTRAISGHPNKDKISEMAKNTSITDQRRGREALSPIHSGSVGMELRISMIR
jgi:hypothetical protein